MRQKNQKQLGHAIPSWTIYTAGCRCRFNFQLSFPVTGYCVQGTAKTIGKIAKNEGVRSAARYLKRDAGRAAIDTALEALDGETVGVAAKKRLKSAQETFYSRVRRVGPSRSLREVSKEKNAAYAVGSRKRRKTKQKPLFYDGDDDDDDDQQDDDY